MLASLVDFLNVVGVNCGDILTTFINEMLPCLHWAMACQEIMNLIVG